MQCDLGGDLVCHMHSSCHRQVMSLQRSASFDSMVLYQLCTTFVANGLRKHTLFSEISPV